MFTRRLASATAVAAMCLGGLAAPVMAAPPPNDDVAAPTVVGVPDGLFQDTSEATADPTDPLLSCSVPAGATVWFAFTAITDQRVEFNTFGSDYDTTLSAYQGSPSIGTEVACNDDHAEDLTSRVRFDATAGTTYLIMVGSFGEGPGGSLMLQSDVAPIPLELGVTIDRRGTIVPTTGGATITGTVSCSRPTMVRLEAGLTQRIGRGLVQGTSHIEIECQATATWELLISASDGLLRPGNADARAVASGDDDASAEALAPVLLTGARPRR